MIKIIDVCKNNFEKLSTSKVDEHTTSRYSMSTIWEFDAAENKHDVYRRKDCMEKFCESLREHTIKILNLAKKRMVPLTNKKQESNKKTKICYIYEKVSYISTLMIKAIPK